MNMKPLAMLAMSSLALSFATVAPAMADDLSAPAAPTVQTTQPSDSSNAPSSMQIAAGPSTTDSATATQADANTNVGGGNDEGTPDTATGDDDY